MRFYFASADNEVKNWKLDRAGGDHRLTSYFLLDGALAKNAPSPVLAAGGHDKIFLQARDAACKRAEAHFRSHTSVKSWVMDSGAYTYQQPKNRLPEASLMKYAERYIEFCARTVDLWDWCAEMDVENGYGMPFVDRVWDMMLAAGLPALRVWHARRGIDAWKKHCKESEYVGIGSSCRDVHPDDIKQLLRWAYANGNKVHAFGVLSGNLMKWPAFSSDATTWLSPEVFGRIIQFDKTKGRIASHSPREKGIKVSVVHPIAESRSKGYDAATLSAIEEFLKYEDYITRSWAERGVTFDGRSGEPTWCPPKE